MLCIFAVVVCTTAAYAVHGCRALTGSEHFGFLGMLVCICSNAVVVWCDSSLCGCLAAELGSLETRISADGLQKFNGQEARSHCVSYRNVSSVHVNRYTTEAEFKEMYLVI
jgi:hypothetical protein